MRPRVFGTWMKTPFTGHTVFCLFLSLQCSAYVGIRISNLLHLVNQAKMYYRSSVSDNTYWLRLGICDENKLESFPRYNISAATCRQKCEANPLYITFFIVQTLIYLANQSVSKLQLFQMCAVLSFQRGLFYVLQTLSPALQT